jgi:hypothetical protein
MKLSYLLLTLVFFMTLVTVGCSQAKQEEVQGSSTTEIHLTEQVEGIFEGYADGDQIIISQNNKQEYYLISSDVVGDLDIVKVGDQIYFSFEKSEEGRLVLQTLRLGE